MANLSLISHMVLNKKAEEAVEFSKYHIFARIRHFFTQIFTLNTGVRLIHKARNLGCFTSSAQATQRSQIDDQPLPQPVSELRLGYDFISIVFLTCLARL